MNAGVNVKIKDIKFKRCAQCCSKVILFKIMMLGYAVKVDLLR